MRAWQLVRPWFGKLSSQSPISDWVWHQNLVRIFESYGDVCFNFYLRLAATVAMTRDLLKSRTFKLQPRET
eukprot:scaffold2612_cov267-Chaetoceros_neogracile.AAC.22